MDTSKKIDTKTKTILLVLGALCCGGAAAYFTSGYIDNEVIAHKKELASIYEKVKVVVPKVDLRAGDVITYDNVVIREMPKGFLHKDTIYPNNIKQVAGLQLSSSISTGAALLLSHISRKRGAEITSFIKHGQRAITFPIDTLSSLSGMLRPKDNIDLMITMTAGSQSKTFPLIENVKVMATGTTVEKVYGDSKKQNYSTITLAVSALNAGRILHARKVGRLSILLRSSEDTDLAFNKPITMNTVLGIPEKSKSKGRAYRPKAEIIRGSIGK